jgi:hypothetical protein
LLAANVFTPAKQTSVKKYDAKNEPNRYGSIDHVSPMKAQQSRSRIGAVA